MPYTAKQKRFFQAVAHGMKPTKTKSKLTPGKAKQILSKAKREGYAMGGVLGRVLPQALRGSTGPAREPMSVSPRSPSGAKGSLGSTAKLGPLARLGSGFRAATARPTVRAGATLSGRPLPRPTPTSNLRPRPGRAVNARLALAGTPYHEASDRLSQLRKRIQPVKGSMV